MKSTKSKAHLWFFKYSTMQDIIRGNGTHVFRLNENREIGTYLRYIFPGFLHLIIMIYENSSTPLSYKSVLCDIYIEIDASGNVDVSWCCMHDIYI